MTSRDPIGGRDGAVHAVHTFHHYKHVVFTLPECHKPGLGLAKGRAPHGHVIVRELASGEGGA
jgi:hypothetical protein